MRLRKVLKDSFAGILKAQSQVLVVVKGFCEQTELEKYYDIYDISELDMSDALREFDATEFEDPESLKSLKILAARFNIVRRMFLCALLALDTNEESTDLLRWTTAVESLRNMNIATKDAFNKLQRTLSEEECELTIKALFLEDHADEIHSVSNATNSEGAAYTRERALAVPDAKTKLHVFWDPWLAGQAPASAGGVRPRLERRSRYL